MNDQAESRRCHRNIDRTAVLQLMRRKLRDARYEGRGVYLSQDLVARVVQGLETARGIRMRQSRERIESLMVRLPE